jgi:hypothetical protein
MSATPSFVLSIHPGKKLENEQYRNTDDRNNQIFVEAYQDSRFESVGEPHNPHHNVFFGRPRDTPVSALHASKRDQVNNHGMRRIGGQPLDHTRMGRETGLFDHCCFQCLEVVPISHRNAKINIQ